MFDVSKIKIYSDGIDKLEFELNNYFEFFSHYIKKNSETIVEIKNKLDEDFKMQVSLINKEDDDAYADLHFEYREKLDREYERFKEINYKTMVLHLFSFLESNLRKLAIITKEKLELPLNYQDIKADDDLKLYKKYFEKVAGVLFSKEAINNWGKLNKYRIIRNAIVHNTKCEWNIKPYDKKIKELDELISKHPLLEKNQTDDTFNIKNEQFLLNFLNLIDLFIKEMFDTVDSSIKKLDTQSKIKKI